MPVIPFPSPGVPKALQSLLDKFTKFPPTPGAVLRLEPEEAEAWTWLVSLGWKPHVHWIVVSGDRWMRFVDPLPPQAGLADQDHREVAFHLNQAYKTAQRVVTSTISPLLARDSIDNELANALLHVTEAVTIYIQKVQHSVINRGLLGRRVAEAEKGEASTCSDVE